MKYNFKIFLISVVITMLAILCACYGTMDSKFSDAIDVVQVKQQLPELYKLTVPNIVRIHNKKNYNFGTGFIIDRQKGIIVTANHLVKTYKEFSIEFYSGKRTTGFVKAVDILNDIAIIEVDPNSLKDDVIFDLKFRTNTNIGEFVYCIGCPMAIKNVVSSGILCSDIILGINIKIKINSPIPLPSKFYISDITTDFGSSGSPLLDSQGRVIGIIVRFLGEYTLIVPASSIENLINKNISL